MCECEPKQQLYLKGHKKFERRRKEKNIVQHFLMNDHYFAIDHHFICLPAWLPLQSPSILVLICMMIDNSPVDRWKFRAKQWYKQIVLKLSLLKGLAVHRRR